MENKFIKKISYTLDSPCTYDPKNFGFKEINGTGKGVKICVIDSGIPQHSVLPVFKTWTNVTNSNTFYDTLGHSTVISGTISSNHETLKGMAYEAELKFVKAIDIEQKAGFDGLITGILWGIIQDVDIILMAVTSAYHNNTFHDVIKKAYNENICLISSTGNENKIEYPSLYDEVLSVGSLNQSGLQAEYSAQGKINICSENVPTTYLQNSYAYMSGTSVSAAITAAVMARIIENNPNLTVNEYYQKIKELKI